MCLTWVPNHSVSFLTHSAHKYLLDEFTEETRTSKTHVYRVRPRDVTAEDTEKQSAETDQR